MANMKNQTNKTKGSPSLRQKAEEKLKKKQSETKSSYSEVDLLKLIHELQVHQIELELQKEELLHAKEQEELAKEKYNNLFDFAPLAYFTLTERGNITELNFAGAQMLGKDRQKLINNRLVLYVDINSRIAFNDFIAKVFSSKNSPNCEVTFCTHEKTYIYTLLNGTVAEDGKHCQIIATDITQLKQAKELLLRKEYDLRESQRIAHVGSWRLDIATNEVIWTEELYNIYGFDSSIPPPPYSEHMKLFTPESWERLSSALAHTRETAIPYTLELETVKKDGSNGWIWVRGEADVDSSGKTVALWGAAQDISDRKISENDLRWRIEDLQLINSINQAANRNENLELILKNIGEQLRLVFNSHLVSIHLPNEKTGEFIMYSNDLDVDLVQKIKKLIGREIPQIRLKVNSEHPFSEIERNGKGILFTSKKAIVNRLAVYLKGTNWPLVVQSHIKKMLPAVCKLLDYQSVVAVPLIANGKTIGFLEIGSRVMLSNNDLIRIQYIAEHVAAVIVRQEYEKKLRESELQYRNLAESGSALIWTSGTDKLCNYFNNIWLKYTGRTIEQEIGNGWTASIHPDDFDYYNETYYSAFDRKVPFEMEFRLRHASGEYRWMVNMGTPNYNSFGEFIGYIGHFFDITERKNSELALLQSEDKYRNIFESVEDVYFEASMDGILLEVSPSIEKITKGQFKRNEMIGKSFASIYFNTGERDLYISKLIKQKRVNDYELSLKNKDGLIIPVAVSSALSYNSNGIPVKITGILRDITERKIAENKLKETLEQLNHTNKHLEKRVEERTLDILELSGLQKAILVNAPVAIMTTDKNGKFQSINPAGEKMLGYNAHELVGKSKPVFQDKDEFVKFFFDAKFEDEPTNDEIFDVALKYMFHKTTEWTWVRKNGEKFPVRITHSSIVDDNGDLIGYMAIVIDITHEKLAMKTLRESEAENRAIIQAVPDLMFRIHRDGTYLDSHSHNQSSLYVPKDHFVGKKVSEILPSDLAIQSMQSIEKAFTTGEVVQYEYMLTVQNRNSYFENRIIAISETEVLSIIRDITARKIAENELQEAVQKLIALIQNLNAGILFENENRQITLVNNSFCNIFNIQATPEQLIGYDCELASEESKSLMKNPAGFISRIDEILSGNEIVVNDELFLLDGRVLERDYIPIENNGALLGHLWQYRDITNRKATETALKLQSAAFEYFALAIIITDINGRLTWANSAFTKLTGYSLDEVIGKNMGELVKSGKQEYGFYNQLWNTLLNHKVWTGELINRKKDGSLYFEEETITPVLNSEGNISSFIAIKIDITERKKLYQELADEKRRLADIINGTNVGTWEWNIQTGETIFNEQWAEMLGYSLEEIEPVSIETWMNFAHPDDLKSSGELLERHFNGELDYYSFESRMKHRNGDWIWVLDRGKVHKWDSNGRPLLMSGTHQDITDRHNYENTLKEAIIKQKELVDLKTTFVSMVSHEFRTPLSIILAATDSLASYWERMTIAQREQKLQKIIEQVKRLTGYIQEMLHLTKLQSNEKKLEIQTFNIVELFLQLISEHNMMIDNSNRIDFSTDLDYLEVNLNREEMISIVNNLLSNSLKYSAADKKIKVKLYKKDLNLIFSVIDKGIGIPEKELDNLFIPFFRASNSTGIPGTGLGLTIIKEAIERHGGTVSVRSIVNSGTEFIVSLPISTNM